jgi:hypothetical protein
MSSCQVIRYIFECTTHEGNVITKVKSDAGNVLCDGNKGDNGVAELWCDLKGLVSESRLISKPHDNLCM